MNDHARAWLARSAVHSTGFIAGQHRQLEWLELTDSEVADIEGLIEYHRLAINDIERLLPDNELFAAWQRAANNDGNSAAAVLLAEMNRRGLAA